MAGLQQNTAHTETEGTLCRPWGQRCKKAELTRQDVLWCVQGGEGRRLPIPVDRERKRTAGRWESIRKAKGKDTRWRPES